MSKDPVQHYCKVCDETFEFPHFVASHRAKNGDRHAVEAQMRIYTEDPFDIPSRRNEANN